MQAVVRLSRKSPILLGEETLDVERVGNPLLEIDGQTPVPWVLDYQLDTMAIKYMMSLNSQVLRGLRDLFFCPRKHVKHTWYEAHLTCFVLISTLEEVYQHQVRYRQRMVNRVSNFLILICRLRANKNASER